MGTHGWESGNGLAQRRRGCPSYLKTTTCVWKWTWTWFQGLLPPNALAFAFHVMKKTSHCLLMLSVFLPSTTIAQILVLVLVLVQGLHVVPAMRKKKSPGGKRGPNRKKMKPQCRFCVMTTQGALFVSRSSPPDKSPTNRRMSCQPTRYWHTSPASPHPLRTNISSSEPKSRNKGNWSLARFANEPHAPLVRKSVNNATKRSAPFALPTIIMAPTRALCALTVLGKKKKNAAMIALV
jgi:hypothetical protein